MAAMVRIARGVGDSRRGVQMEHGRTGRAVFRDLDLLTTLFEISSDIVTHGIIDGQGTGLSETSGGIGIGVEGVLVVSGSETREHNRALRRNAEVDKVEQQIQGALVLKVPSPRR